MDYNSLLYYRKSDVALAQAAVKKVNTLTIIVFANSLKPKRDTPCFRLLGMDLSSSMNFGRYIEFIASLLVFPKLGTLINYFEFLHCAYVFLFINSECIIAYHCVWSE